MTIRDRVKAYVLDEEVLKIDYPISDYPEKVSSLNLEKKNSYTGVLKGVKGQYLIFEDNTVYNIRSNEGTVVTLTV